MNILIYCGILSIMVVVGCFSFIYALFFNAPALIGLIKEEFLKPEKLERMIKWFKKDYASFATERFCKRNGHQWEHGSYGRCVRDCGYYRPEEAEDVQ